MDVLIIIGLALITLLLGAVIFWRARQERQAEERWKRMEQEILEREAREREEVDRIVKRIKEELRR